MKHLIEQIDNAFIGLAWRLWNTLGVAGDSPQHQDCLIDLEALIVLTTVVGKSDPRLLEEALDWCSKFHGFVSISRLRPLIAELGPQIHIPFSTFAETLNSISQSKWPTFAKTSPLPIKLSGKSQAPNCRVPALLGLRLRALFGVGARADLATFFLTQPSQPFTAADTVEIGYTKRTLADALDALVQSGLLSCSMNKNQKQYRLVKKDPLANLAGELPRLVPDWRSILAVFVTLRNTLLEHQDHSISSKIVAIRNVLASLKDHLQKLHISPPPLSSDPAHWETFIQWVGETVKELAALGNLQSTSPIAAPFEKTFFSLMQHLYKVDDCVDGLDFIIDLSAEHPIRHQEIFKECYQMSLCYLEELQSRLGDFLKFPIHLLMDVKLSEILYKYSQEELPAFLHFVKNTPPTTEISLPGIALIGYKNLEVELSKIHRFLNEVKKRLKELYFHTTNDHLLTQSPTLYKRHAVLKLFSLP